MSQRYAVFSVRCLVSICFVFLSACMLNTRTERATQTQQARTPSGIAYDVTGTGPAILFVHGFSVDRRVWNAELRALSKHYRVIRLDSRGHGQSADPVAGRTNGADLIDVLQHSGTARAVIVGHSSGAGAAVEAALQEPARVAALVLLSPAIPGIRVQSAPSSMENVITFVRAGDYRGAAREWIKTPLMTIRAQPGAVDAFHNIVMENSRIWSLSPSAGPTPMAPAWTTIQALKMPVYGIVGVTDLSGAVAVSDSLRARVGAEVASVPSAGHWVTLDQPEETQKRLMQILRKFEGY